MRTTGSSLLLVLMSLGPGCSVDDRILHLAGAPKDGAGTTSETSADRFAIPLSPNAGGMLDGSNAAGIVGGWYIFTDATDGTCKGAGFSDEQCSQVSRPNPLSPFTPTSLPDGSMCVTGVAAQVIDRPGTTTLAFGVIYGVGMGFDLNNPGDGRQAYDASAHGITGLSFTVNNPPDGGLRVGLATSDSPWDFPYWGGRTGLVSPVLAGGNAFRWSDVGGPSYVNNPPPFNPSHVLSFYVEIPSTLFAPIPFDFCISHVLALRD